MRRTTRLITAVLLLIAPLAVIPAAQASTTQQVSGTVLHPATTGAVARNAWLSSGGLVNGVSGYVFEVNPATVGERFIMRSEDFGASRWTDLNVTFYDLDDAGAYVACQIYDFLNPYEAGRVCGVLGIVWSFSGGPADFTYEAGAGVAYGGVEASEGPIAHAGRVDFTTGTDLDFEGDLAYVGSEDPDPREGGLHIINIADPHNPVELGHLPCPAQQNDVAVWNGIVAMAIDSPSTNTVCAPVDAEGVRVVDARDPANPVQVAFFEKAAPLAVPGVLTAGAGGAHTVTMVGDGYAYANNYEVGTVDVLDLRPVLTGGQPIHAGVINVGPGGQSGCHDISIQGDKAFCAAITHTEIWDVKNPVTPVVLGSVVNPAINIHHSTAVDGNTLVIGDEFTGAAAAMGCQLGGAGPAGALWFYDISDPSSPVLKGYFNTPEMYPGVRYTAHNFNIIPGTNYLVAAWYRAGVRVIDFTEPTQPTQVAYAMGDGSVTWSAYWYRDAIFTGDLHRGMDAFTLDLPGVPKP